MINIIGLGATDKNGLTLQALEYIKDEHPNYLRTASVEAIKEFEELNVEYTSFDYLYDTENTFEEVYDKIVEILCRESQDRTINYFVPGTPLIAEKTVMKLIEKDVEIKLVAGVSFIEHVLNAVKRDPSKGFLLLDADDFSFFDINPRIDILITQVYNFRTAVEIKLALSEIYSDNYEVIFLKDAGLDTEEVKKIKIYEMDSMQYNHQCAIYIPKSEIKSIGDILEEMKKTGRPKEVDIDNLVKSLKDNLEDLVSLDLSGEYYIYDVFNEIFNKKR